MKNNLSAAQAAILKSLLESHPEGFSMSQGRKLKGPVQLVNDGVQIMPYDKGMVGRIRVKSTLPEASGPQTLPVFIPRPLHQKIADDARQTMHQFPTLDPSDYALRYGRLRPKLYEGRPTLDFSPLNEIINVGGENMLVHWIVAAAFNASLSPASRPFTNNVDALFSTQLGQIVRGSTGTNLLGGESHDLRVFINGDTNPARVFAIPREGNLYNGNEAFTTVEDFSFSLLSSTQFLFYHRSMSQSVLLGRMRQASAAFLQAAQLRGENLTDSDMQAVAEESAKVILSKAKMARVQAGDTTLTIHESTSVEFDGI